MRYINRLFTYLLTYLPYTFNFVAGFWQQIGNNVNSTARRGRLYCRYVQLCCWYGRLCRQCVYGAKATRSTFNKVDCVEFSLVASVYRAYIDSKGNYSATWYTGCWWVGCYIWYSEEEPGRATAPPRCTKCNSSPAINSQSTITNHAVYCYCFYIAAIWRIKL